MLALLPALGAIDAADGIHGFQGGGPLLGLAESIPAPPMKVRWTYKTDEVERAGVEGSPVIAGDVVYVADGRGTLHAIDLKSGTTRWKYKAEDAFVSTPLISGGKIFIGDMGGIFHAISADEGKKLWTRDTESPIHSSANMLGDRVIFGTDGAEIFCVNALDGVVLWKQKAGDRINSAPAIGNGLAFISGCDAQLRGIDIATGQEKFSTPLPSLAPGSPAFVKDRLVIGTDGGHVLCISVDGQKTLWSYDQIDESAMAYASPAVADGIAVIGARDRQVHAIDLATGVRKWTFKTRGDVDGAATISDGRVYVCSKDKRLYVLDLKTGKSLWEFNAARYMEAGPAIGAGVVVIGDSGGSVFCLEPANR